MADVLNQIAGGAMDQTLIILKYIGISISTFLVIIGGILIAYNKLK